MHSCISERIFHYLFFYITYFSLFLGNVGFLKIVFELESQTCDLHLLTALHPMIKMSTREWWAEKIYFLCWLHVLSIYSTSGWSLSSSQKLPFIILIIWSVARISICKTFFKSQFKAILWVSKNHCTCLISSSTRKHMHGLFIIK